MSSKAKDILLAMDNSAPANLAKAHDINLALAEFPIAKIIFLASTNLALTLRLVEEKILWNEVRRQRSLPAESESSAESPHIFRDRYVWIVLGCAMGISELPVPVIFDGSASAGWYGPYRFGRSHTAST